MIRIGQLSLFWVMLLLGPTHAVWSSPLEDRLLADAADGRWDQHTLIRAALISSDVRDPQELLKFERRYASVIGQLKRQPWRTMPAGSKAKQLLLWLHENVLTGGYQKDTSSLAQALDQGRFNCVSSAILYHALAEELGLKTQLVALPEHVFVELKMGKYPRRIETTTPGGAFPASVSEIPSQAKTQAPRRVLSQVQAISLFYYNRGTISFRKKDFAASVASNLTAVRLDPDHPESRANLISSINNWAVQLSKQQRYRQASALIEAGLALAPGDANLTANLIYLKQNQRAGESRNNSVENVSAQTPNP